MAPALGNGIITLAFDVEIRDGKVATTPLSHNQKTKVEMCYAYENVSLSSVGPTERSKHYRPNRADNMQLSLGAIVSTLLNYDRVLEHQCE
jgi:hypothetical protein